MRLLLPLLAAFSTFAAGNQVVLNLEPTKENPRSSEGAFVTLKSGRVVFMYTQFYGGARDNSPARIVAIHSDDAGRTWNREPRVIVDNQAAENVMSVSLLRLKGGRIALFYLIKNHWIDCRPYVQFSDDEGATWSKPVLVVAAPGYFVLNNDRVIQTSSGRLIVPVAFHRAKGTDPHSSKSFDSRAIAMWYLSDDEGRTWREADTWWALPEHGRTGMQEPGVAELPDGRLISWSRTDQGAQYGCVSTDDGRTWSAPQPTKLQSPVSPASIKILPGTKALLAVWNDHSGEFPFPKGNRTPLVAGISTDATATWRVLKVLEDDPDGWYCYTAIHFVDDAVLLAYCAGDSKIGGLNRLRIRRIERGWFEGQAR
jgi:sialidase-1